jgi:hypothetical protein
MLTNLQIKTFNYFYQKLMTITCPISFKINTGNNYKAVILRRDHHPDVLIFVAVSFQRKGAVALLADAAFGFIQSAVF